MTTDKIILESVSDSDKKIVIDTANNVASINTVGLPLVINGRSPNVPPAGQVPTIGIIGTSSVAQGIANLGPNSVQAYYMTSFVGHLVAHCPQVDFPIDSILGFSGGNTNDMVVGIEQIIATRPRLTAIIIQITGNDSSSGSITWATTKANIDYMVRRCFEEGIIPILLTQHPTTDMSSTDSNAKKYLRAINYVKYLKATLPGVYIADFANVTADKNVATFTTLSGYSTDGTHLNKFGSHHAAVKALKPVIDAIFPPIPYDYTAVTAADTWDATNNPNGCLNNNPQVIGTGGTAGSVVSSGDVAANYTISATWPNTECTVVASKVVDANGKPWQRLAFTGTVLTEGTYLQFAPSFILGALASLKVGDVVSMICQARVISGHDKLNLFAARLTFQETGFTDVDRRFNTLTPSQYVPDPAYDGIYTLKIPVKIVRGPVTGATSTRLLVSPVYNVSLSGLVIEFGSMAIRKENI